jgi:hypothetical protein
MHRVWGSAAAAVIVSFASRAHAQQGVCDVDPSACPSDDALRATTRRPLPGAMPPRKPPEPEEPQEVTIRTKPPPRTASDWEVDKTVLTATPKESGADVLNTVPGVFVGDRGLLGRAPHLSLRGFDGTAGQDVEIFVGNVPMNQVSNVRAPGYADMRLVMPEIVRAVRISNGPYDPRQGDDAIAGSVHMDLGLEQTGFVAKGTYGSFGSRRIFLAFAPDDRHLRDTFAAFEAYGIDGPGSGRGGERSSFVGQLAGGDDKLLFRGTVAIGSARFDFPGYLPQALVERGAYAYGTTSPLGRDRSAQSFGGLEMVWELGDGALVIGMFASKTSMEIHQDLTGYVVDPVNGDDGEQTNEASNIGLNTSYRHPVKLTSTRDMVEFGIYGRIDTVEQHDTRLKEDQSKNVSLVDATINATNLAAYADASLYPIRRVVVRGGTRLDSLSYGVTDRVTNAGLDRTAQGLHVGNKATVDVAAGGGVHVIASYGEGFRSPQARTLSEGERLPFATVRAVEAGLRAREARKAWQASLVGFQSWLSHDQVFDATARGNVEAPPSSRTGVAAAVTGHGGPFVSAFATTYSRAVFTGSDATFAEGDTVPYAPALVVRDDSTVGFGLGKWGRDEVKARVGAGFEAAALRTLPGGRDGMNVFELDALAGVSWRELELTLNGMNLLGLKYYDAQYVYASSFEKGAPPPAPSPHVLVAAPTSVFLTLSVHLKGFSANDSHGATDD